MNSKSTDKLCDTLIEHAEKLKKYNAAKKKYGEIYTKNDIVDDMVNLEEKFGELLTSYIFALNLITKEQTKAEKTLYILIAKLVADNNLKCSQDKLLAELLTESED